MRLAGPMVVVTVVVSSPVWAARSQPAAPPAAPPAAAAALLAAEALPKNLEVLPKTMTRREVIDVMKTWTGDLGVRCEHCHVEVEGKPVLEWDLAADTKPTKRIAREMVRLLEASNKALEAVARIRADGSAAPHVSCATCHHGVPQPKRIEDLFDEVRAKDGMDAAVARYRELRSRFHLMGSYDFSPAPLVRLARRTLAQKDAPTARRVLGLALEYGPDSLNLRANLAEADLAAGDRAAAKVQLEAALAMAQSEEEKAFVQKRLADLAALEPKN